MAGKKLTAEWYQRPDTVALARELLGKVLCTQFDGQTTRAIISETEAYCGAEDKACHAYGNRRTKRTETMFLPGGAAYVYLCYGIHHLFNVVTHAQDVPHAILVRAVQPLEGVEIMLQRRGHTKQSKKLSAGPGTMSQAMGITTAYNATNLQSSSIWIENHGISIPAAQVETTPRIGVDYAGEDAKLPYRFEVQAAIAH